MTIFEKMRFSVHVGLVARRQKMLGQPKIIKCSTKGKTTTYRIRGSKATWEVKVKSIDIYDSKGA